MTANLRRLALSPWRIVLLGALIYLLVVLSSSRWDPMSFILVGGRFDDRVENNALGYDGQFAYQIGRDPLNGWRYVDVPAYRYQRILYPLLARILALGNGAVLPWTLILINLGSLAAGAWVMERLLVEHGQNRWAALSYGLFAGLWMALRLDLTEPLAFLFILGGLWAFERKRLVLSAGLMAAAALTREVTLAFAAACVLGMVSNRKARTGLLWGGAVLLPFAAWQAVLWGWFGSIGLRGGGAMSTPLEVIPFHGWWGFAFQDLAAFLLLSAWVVPVAVLPATVAIWQAVRALWRGSRGEAEWALLINGLLIMILPRSILLDPLGLIRTLVGLVTAVLYFGLRRPSRRALFYPVLWLFLLVFVFVNGFMPRYP